MACNLDKELREYFLNLKNKFRFRSKLRSCTFMGVLQLLGGDMGLGQAADRDMGEHLHFQTFSPLFNRFSGMTVGLLPYNHNDLQLQFWPQLRL